MRNSQGSSPRLRHGGVTRGLVVVLGVLALAWLVYLAQLPKNLQEKEFPMFLGAAVCAGVLVLIVRMAERLSAPDPAKARRNLTFWLSPAGGEDATGPYTVDQLVTMWRSGQITTQGMVAKEGTEQWMPILAFAERFDEPASRTTLARNGAALLLLGLILLLFVPPLGGLLFVIGLVLWIVGSSLKK